MILIISSRVGSQILSVLVEGNSLRATARICDVAFNTVLKFVPEICDADTKLVPSWYVSDRSACAAKEFIGDLAERLNNRAQLTTDGHKAYLEAVEDAFGSEIDYAMLVKLYGKSPDTPETKVVFLTTHRFIIVH